MALKYRGVEYNTDHRDGSTWMKELTYRGTKYSSIRPIKGSCRRVTMHETYRGIKHDEVKTVCA